MTDYDHYCGDVNLEYGGMWFDLSDYPHYVSVLRVTDLDGGCGFTGAILIEKLVTFGFESKDRVRKAIDCCMGFESFKDIKGRQQRILAVAESLVSYGCYDLDDDYVSPSWEVVQCEHDGPQSFDGWSADVVLTEGQTIEEYMEGQYGVSCR